MSETQKQVMPRVNGEPFRCKCGCNVFTEVRPSACSATGASSGIKLSRRKRNRPMTHGDTNSIKCPHCGKGHKPAIDHPVAHGQIIKAELPCPRCGKWVYYWARWTITVDAEKAEKTQ